MATVTTDNSYYSAIADAIRAKNGGTATYKPSEMAAAIENIIIGGEDNIAALCRNQLTDYASSELTTISAPVFYNNTGLQTVSLPNVAGQISAYAFFGCSKLTSVSLPSLTKLNDRVFSGCTKLTSVDLPTVTEIPTNNGSYTFYNCTSLTSIYLPALQTTGSFTFYSCTSLATVDLPMATSIGAQLFNRCSSLETLILRATDAIATLGHTNAFTSTPIASGTGYIYVPSSLVDTYKADSKWSTYADQIRAIEDYPDITGG